MNAANRYQQLFSDCLVPAISLDDFIDKYRRADRLRQRGAEYIAAVKASHMEDLRTYGITWVSHYDSATGQTVSWMPDAPKVTA